jgi:hypothetical protein
MTHKKLPWYKAINWSYLWWIFLVGACIVIGVAIVMIQVD